MCLICIWVNVVEHVSLTSFLDFCPVLNVLFRTMFPYNFFNKLCSLPSKFNVLKVQELILLPVLHALFLLAYFCSGILANEGNHDYFHHVISYPQISLLRCR